MDDWVELLPRLAGSHRRCEMGSINPPKKRDYGKNTRIDLNQSYQVAYWKERFGISEEELIEAVRTAGGLARNVETYLKEKRVQR
jgi:Protein of unknown function (DUF3606)